MTVTWFVDHSADDLVQIAGAIGQERLTPPFTAIGLGRLGVSDAQALASELNRLVGCGFQAVHLVVLLNALVSERRSLSAQAPALELVVTGPDVREQARDTAVVVEQLFEEAQV